MDRIGRIKMPAPESGFPKNSAPDDIFQGAVVRTVSEDALLGVFYCAGLDGSSFAPIIRSHKVSPNSPIKPTAKLK